MNKRIFRILTIGWSLTILFLTLSPDDGGTGFWFLKIPGMDKVAHFGIFLILSYLSIPAFNISNWSKKYIIAAAIFYGLALSMLTEYGQQFVQGRSSDVFDFLADSIGVVFGALLAIKFPFLNRL